MLESVAEVGGPQSMGCGPRVETLPCSSMRSMHTQGNQTKQPSKGGTRPKPDVTEARALGAEKVFGGQRIRSQLPGYYYHLPLVVD